MQDALGRGVSLWLNTPEKKPYAFNITLNLNLSWDTLLKDFDVQVRKFFVVNYKPL